ncbi:MAG: type II secretion system protein GspG [Kiritimatiellae bacterium]|nr:type II secretion system protein GspG [Kiritimatiellia bacterium]
MKKDNTFVAAAKRGFTLIELLVVVAILGILGAVAVQQLMGSTDDAKLVAAKTSVDNIKSAVMQYEIKHKKLPESLTDLVKGERTFLDGGEGALIDPWDHPYELKKDGKKFYIVSGGPDESIGTEDDIRSDKTQKSAEK